MAILAPKLSGDVAVRQPIAAPQQIAAGQGLVTLASTGLSMLQAQKDADAQTGKISETDRKGMALRPFAQRVEELRMSNISDADFQRVVRAEALRTITAYPEYRSDIEGIAGFTGVEPETLQQTPEESRATVFNEWMQGPEGQAAMITSATFDDSGTLDPVATQENLQISFQESQVEQAQLARTNRRLEQTTANRELHITESQNAFETFRPQWVGKATNLVNGLVNAAAAGKAELDEPAEQMAFLRQQRMRLEAEFQAKAAQAGIHSSVIDEQMNALLRPIDGMIEMAEAMAGDTKTVLDAYINVQRLGAEKMLTENFGVWAQHPEFSKQMMSILASRLYSDEVIKAQLQSAAEAAESGNVDAFQFLPTIPSNTTEAAKGGPVVDPAVVEQDRQRQTENPQHIPTKITGFTANISQAKVDTPEGQQTVLTSIGHVYSAAEAAGTPLGASYLQGTAKEPGIFSARTMNAVRQAIARGGPVGQDIKNTLISFSVSQIRKNEQIISGQLRNRIPDDEDFLLIRQPGGNYIVRTMGVDAPLEQFMSTTDDRMMTAVKNLGIITGAVGRMVDGDPEVMQALSPNLAGAAPTTLAEDTEQFLANPAISFGDPEGIYEIPPTIREDTEFLQEVDGLAQRINVDPADIIRVIAFETGGTFDPAQPNAAGSGATGLIQFMPDTARELGVTTTQLANMTRGQQMKYVSQYLENKLKGVENPTFSDLYMAILWPAAVGKPDDTPILNRSEAQYTQNRGLDTNNDGVITKGEAAAKAFARVGGAANISMPRRGAGTGATGAPSSREGTPTLPTGEAPSVAPAVSENLQGGDPAAVAAYLGQTREVSGGRTEVEGGNAGGGERRTASQAATQAARNQAMSELLQNFTPEEIQEYLNQLEGS